MWTFHVISVLATTSQLKLKLKPLTVYALDDHVDIPRHACVGNHFTTETEPPFALWQTRNVFHNRFILHYVYSLFFPHTYMIYVHFNPLPQFSRLGIQVSLAIYVCLSGLWLSGLLHLSFLSDFLKLVCYAHVFPCSCTCMYMAHVFPCMRRMTCTITRIEHHFQI